MPAPEGMRIDEARERIDALERRLLEVQDQCDSFKSTLLRIAQPATAATKDDLQRLAQIAIYRSEAEFGV
jgi:hypothetical protein